MGATKNRKVRSGMHPFDLDKAQLAVQQSRVADWQLNQALQIFRTRQNPKASILGILVELNYLDKNLALELNRHPSQNLQNSYSNYSDSMRPHNPGVSSSSAPNHFNNTASGSSQDNSPTIAMNSRDFMSALKASDSGSTSDSSSPFLDGPPRTPTAIHPSHSPAPYQSAPPLHSSNAPHMSQAVQSSGAPNYMGQSDIQANVSGELTGSERFGRYELRGTVARGGMGTVYRAYLAELDKTFALKTLGADRDDVDLQRFLHEARAAAKLRHPNIVPVHDIGTQDGKHYFTMDLITGNSLDEIVHKDGNFEPRDAALLCAKLSRALEYAHTSGVIHRDIKPGNILIETSTGEPYITDFGLARSVESSVQLTKTGFAVGTPNYMAPEQASGQKDVDGRADVYGIGTLLYSIICGRPPYDGPNALATMTSVINDPIPSMKVLRPEVPDQLDEICQKAMAKEREDRFASPKKLAEALEACFSESSGRFIAANKSSKQITALLSLIFVLVVIASVLGVIRYQNHVAFSDLLTQSQSARAAGDLDNAARLLEEARKLKPNSDTLAAEAFALEKRLESRKKEALKQKEEDEKKAIAEQKEAAFKRALAEAQDAFERRDYVSSLQSIDKLLLSRPENLPLLLLQAKNNYALLRFPQAEKALESIKAFDQDQSFAQKAPTVLLRAYIAYERGDFNRAQSALDELNTQPNVPPKALILSGYLKHEDRKDNQLLKLFGRIGPDQISNPWYKGLDVLIQRHKHQWRKVLDQSNTLLQSEELMPSLRSRMLIARAESRHWLSLKDQYPSSTQDLREALPLSQKSLRNLQSIQEVALWSRDYNFSTQVLQSASKLISRPGTLAFMKARPNFYRLRDSVGRRHTPQFHKLARSVAQQYLQAEKQGEKSADFQRELARSYFYNQQYQQAIKRFNLANRADPFDPRNIRGLFETYYQTRRYNEAISISQSVIKLNNNDPNLFVILYNCYNQLKDHKNAALTAQRIIKIVPKGYQGYYYLAVSQVALKQRDQARKTAQQALKRINKDLGGSCQGFFICSRTGLGKETDQYFKKILNTPVNQQNLQVLTNFLGNLGRQNLPKYELQLADSLYKSTNRADILIVRGRAHFTLGRTKEAQADLLKAQQTPQFQNANLLNWLLGCIALVQKNVPLAYKYWAKLQNRESEMMFMALRLLCLKKLGQEDTRERALIKAFIPKLQGFQQRLIPLLQYLLGTLSKAQFDQMKKEATNPELLARLYLVLGVQAMFNENKDEAKDCFRKASQLRINFGLLRGFARQLLRSVD